MQIAEAAATNPSAADQLVRDQKDAPETAANALIDSLLQNTNVPEGLRAFCDGTGYSDNVQSACALWFLILEGCRSERALNRAHAERLPKAAFVEILRHRLIPNGMKDLSDPRTSEEHVPMETALLRYLPAAEALLDVYVSDPSKCSLLLGDIGRNMVFAITETHRIILRGTRTEYCGTFGLACTSIILRLIPFASDCDLNSRASSSGQTLLQQVINALLNTCRYYLQLNEEERPIQTSDYERAWAHGMSLFRRILSADVTRSDGTGLNVVDATIGVNMDFPSHFTPSEFLEMHCGPLERVSALSIPWTTELKQILFEAVDRVKTYRTTFLPLLTQALGDALNVSDLRLLICSYVLASRVLPISRTKT